MSGRPRPERPGDLVPEPMEFAGWPPLGALSAELPAGPLSLRLRGLDRAAVESLERWAGPTGGGEGGHPLEIELTRSEREGYLSLPEAGATLRLETWSDPQGGYAMVTHHAALLVDARVERGIAVLARQSPEQLDLSLQNLLRVATAWRLASSGAGLLLHAAAVEEDGRAVLLLGHSGAGKSTAARQAQGRGVLADDVALVTRPASAGRPWQVHASPLWADGSFPGRSTTGPARELSLACTLRKAPRAEAEALPRSRAAVVVASCAPFLGAAPHAFGVAQAAADLARSVPACVLSFAKDEPWWPALVPHLDSRVALSRPPGDR